MSKTPENHKMNLEPRSKKRQIDLESAYRLLITAFLRTASTDENSGDSDEQKRSKKS